MTARSKVLPKSGKVDHIGGNSLSTPNDGLLGQLQNATLRMTPGDGTAGGAPERYQLLEYSRTLVSKTEHANVGFGREPGCGRDREV
jgi:hypothetical protein